MRIGELVVLSVVSLLLISCLQAGESSFMNEWIDSGEYETVPTGSSAGLLLHGNFTVNKGDYITFFICNDGNLTLWKNDDNAILFDYQENVSYHEFEFIIPYEGMWYLVFSNIDIDNQQRQITGFLTRSYPFPDTPPFSGLFFMLFGSLAVGVVMIVFAVVVLRRFSS